MKQEISNHLATGLAATAGVSATATGLMGWLNFYAAGIGVIFTILTFVAWVFFQLRHDKKLSLADKNEEKLDLHITETRSQFKIIDGNMVAILDKLDKQG